MVWSGDGGLRLNRASASGVLAIQSMRATVCTCCRCFRNVAQVLTSAGVEGFHRLSRSLVHGPPLQWVLIDAPDPAVRHGVLRELKPLMLSAGLRVARLELDARISDAMSLESAVAGHVGAVDVLSLMGGSDWFDTNDWHTLNLRREQWAEQAPLRLLFWLDAVSIALAATEAPDFWAWRSGVYAFAHEPDGAIAEHPNAKLPGDVRS